MKTKYVCLAGVNRLVDYAMHCGVSMETLSQWLNDPHDLGPIEMDTYQVSIEISDDFIEALHGDFHEVLKYVDNNKACYFGELARIADLTDKIWDPQTRTLRFTYAVTAGGVHESKKYKDPDEEEEVDE